MFKPLMLFAAILVTSLPAVQAGAHPQETYRQFKSSDGRVSPELKFEGYNEETGIVSLKDRSGKRYETQLGTLSPIDQKLVSQQVAVGETEANDATHFVVVRQPVDGPIGQTKYSLPPDSADEPLVVEEVKTREYEVRVPYTEKVTCVERYGLLGKKCRIVTRSVTRFRSESRTQSFRTVRAVPSLLNDPNHADQTEMISLDAPVTAGAIAERVAQSLDGLYPAGPFDFERAAGGNRVDYRQQVPKDGFRLQIVIDISVSDPRNLDLTVVAIDIQDPSNAPMRVTNELPKVRAAIVKTSP